MEASPFSVRPDQENLTSPFAIPATSNSPFSTISDETASLHQNGSGKPAVIPAPRGHLDQSRFYPDQNSFGFEAPVDSHPVSMPANFQHAEHQINAPKNGTPFGNPFGVAYHTNSVPQVAPMATQSPFDVVPEAATPTPVFQQALPSMPVTVPPAHAPSPAFRNEHQASHPQQTPAMHQLELRAIFGIDRSLSFEEILQRCKTLPSIRNLARIQHHDLLLMNELKSNLSTSFTSGEVRLTVDNLPIDFIIDGGVVLAVATDGSYAPGIKETLIIAVRELAKLA